MVDVYIIESGKDGIWYSEMAMDARKRLMEDNQRKNRFTKGPKPWNLIYLEAAKDWQTGRNREKYLKTSDGKKWIKQILGKHNSDRGA